MQANSRGAQVIAGTVTAATFRGPPIVVCAADENVGFTSFFWQGLLRLADLLDVPAILVDYAHDGGVLPAVQALRTLQPFYGAFPMTPWLPYAVAPSTPICGPLFFADGPGTNPALALPNTGADLARRLSEQTLNFRRNHVYGFGVESVWPVVGENLDLIQRPPIHYCYNGMGQGGPGRPKDWFITNTLPQWRAIQSVNAQQTIAAGLAELALHESVYPGLSRHINGAYVNQPEQLFVYPWN